ncbi:SusC/RagA family TonB-linked outer membrane protein [Chitinophaga silvatica]|uniref:SusC/RagA family TonB-linked outer membrane protein n=1 Tax=Chitinophaga silvatica TaxID=2282649 RepID=A0A3E1Y986_9BACT|nr:TonB-dependent receptor [Chitinophaga silvatica]RFS21963.1 SusC/RagA family TonB-linked outer membrane protein [Chitinophaga silvatica]
MLFRHAGKHPRRPVFAQMLKVMKLAAFLLLVLALQVSATGYSQKLTLNMHDVALSKVFKEIRKQTGYVFFYNTEMLQQTDKVSIAVVQAELEDVLKKCLINKQLNYSIVDNTIILSAKTREQLEEAARPVANISVFGQVTDANTNEPLIGASIKLKGTTKGTSTDAKGNYTLQIPDQGGVLVISFVGYETIERPVAQAGALNISLKPKAVQTEELVVVGYGTQKRKDVTGAVSSVRVGNISANVSKNISGAIQGRVPGVSVESSSGAPGAGLVISIRGLSTLGNNTPLYIIDGVFVSSIDGVSPNDVESIEILKDAATASIYGSRAANGVVLITTKGGRKETPPKLDLDTWVGVQSIPKRMSLLNGEQWTKLLQANVGGIPDYNGVNTNWQDAIFRNALVTRTNANLSGGSKNLTYNLSAGYLKEDGTMINTSYNAANFRIKTDYEKGRLRIGETVMIKRGIGHNAPSGGDQTHSLVGSALVMPATVPLYDATNLLGGYGRHASYMKNLSNPVARLENMDNSSRELSILANAFVEVKLIEGLKYKFNVGLTENQSGSRLFTGVFDDGNSANTAPDLSESTSSANSWLVENTLNYNKKFGKHNIDLLAGYTAQKNTYSGFGASRDDLQQGTSVLNAGLATSQQNNGSANANTLVSKFGRILYSYDSRYLFTASIRRDGSSRFAPGYQYGNFPSLSVGWNLHNEQFFKGIVNTINTLKLRASWGKLGNQEIGNYLTQNSIDNSLNYVQGGVLWPGITVKGYASPTDLSWEETQIINPGLDLGLLNNKLFVIFDIFNKKTNGVLLNVPFPPSVGKSGSPTLNAGSIENKGYEIAIEYTDRAGDLNYRIGLNVSHTANKMTAINIGSGRQEFGGISRAKVGYPIGSFFVVQTGGIFNTKEEVAAHSKNGKLIQPNAQPGDIKFVDFNNDGIIDNQDEQYMGSPFPSVTGGLSANLTYKGFDLGLFLEAVTGNKIYNGRRIWMEKMKEITNFSTDVLNAWTPENHTNFPRFTVSDFNVNGMENTDRWLEDGSYLRLKRVELGYLVPKTITSKWGIERIRVFASGENIFTATKYKGYNPDIGGGFGVRGMDNSWDVYPLSRTFLFGLNLTF